MSKGSGSGWPHSLQQQQGWPPAREPKQQRGPQRIPHSQPLIQLEEGGTQLPILHGGCGIGVGVSGKGTETEELHQSPALQQVIKEIQNQS